MMQKTITESKTIQQQAVDALEAKKGVNITMMDLRNVPGAITDYFVICTGTSDKHVQALADSVEEQLKLNLDERPINVEGHSQGEWVLIDYVDLVVHVFIREKRDFYNIEDLWGDAVFTHYSE